MSTPSLNKIPMIRLQRDVDALMGNKRPLAIAGRKTAVLSAFWYLRDLPEAKASPILFLLHSPKKQTKPAHERNRLKRWMREAIRQSEEMKAAIVELQKDNAQALVLIRATMPPSKDCSWNQIRDDIHIISASLIEKLQTS